MIKKLHGANMDIDLSTPEDRISWKQAPCPWNETENSDAHKCAVKNVSICPYFCGIEYLDTVLCCYPNEKGVFQMGCRGEAIGKKYSF